mgnify:FL=1
MSSVRRAGRLLSRRELRAAGVQPAGLGGGVDDEAAGWVSTVLRPEDAERLVRAMHLMALAARNKVPAWIVAREAIAFSGWDDYMGEASVFWDTPVWEKIETLGRELQAQILSLAVDFPDLAESDALDLAVWLYDHRHEIERAHPSGQPKYDLARAIERIATDLRWVVVQDSDYVLSRQAPVGFTLDYKQWAHVDPRGIRALRLAAREEAEIDINPVEMEIRFLPKDLRVLGTEGWGGLRRW